MSRWRDCRFVVVDRIWQMGFVMLIDIVDLELRRWRHGEIERIGGLHDSSRITIASSSVEPTTKALELKRGFVLLFSLS